MSLWTVAPSRQAELMDDPSLATADHLHALSALARINAFSGTAPQLAAAIRRLTAAALPLDRPLEIVDVACGGGDVTLALARRLARQQLGQGRAGSQDAIKLTGIDLSPRAPRSRVWRSTRRSSRRRSKPALTGSRRLRSRRSPRRPIGYGSLLDRPRRSCSKRIMP
ncbi:MAG: hypothetical protein ACKOHG_00140 [Planctomycetia bacterium]